MKFKNYKNTFFRFQVKPSYQGNKKKLKFI